MSHLLLINSGKAEALGELRAVVPEARVTVLTEPAYRPQYPAGTDLVFVGDIGDLTAVRKAVLALSATNPVDHVVSPSERSMPAGGFLRSYLGLPGTGFDVANRFTNKAVMKRALTDLGLPVAAHRVVSGLPAAVRAAAELGGPVVVKPAFGTGSMNVHGFDSPARLAEFATSAAADKLRNAGCPLLVEEKIAMSAEYHADAVIVGSEVRFCSVGRYLVPQLDPVGRLNGSAIVPADSPAAAAVRALHEQVALGLGLRDGVTHCEIYETPAGLVVGEISCRPAGGGIADAIKTQYGVDIWDAFNRLALGLPVALPPAGRAVGGIVAVCLLPVRPGRVLRVTPAEELEALDGVLSVSMKVGPGSVIGTRLHSASTAGILLLEAPDEETLGKRVDRVVEQFRLDVEALCGD
ncbi:ATP-grasp domain-containing protein [Paractinoplanes ferrugineus]|uniref:Argininosuccinate lyase n=1 Tax=Paractinoplanes ferrugineus TaxID=113564 RepID=A0A919J1G9_9ACTN|nr:hypothetical protein [Actinoplanes ferrugineus]GIE10704.1 argininosuccinate lyase [Actinoplanes ferrugineus]